MRIARLTLLALLALLALPACADFDTFEAVVGMDDEALYFPASSAFQVYLDDELAWESAVLRPGDEAVAVSVPLAGAERLRLVVTDGGDTIRNDRADWADARLVGSESGDVVFLSDMVWKTRDDWITARIDRTVTGNPLTLNGVVYCRGLGGFARMDYEWTGWDELAAETGAARERDAREGAEACGGSVLLSAPAGVTVRSGSEVLHDGATAAAGLAVDSHATLTFEVAAYSGESVRSSVLASVRVSCPRGEAALADLVPDVIRNPLTPEAAPDDAPVLDGSAYLGGSGAGAPASFTYHALARKLASALAARESQGAARLTGVVGLAPASGVFSGTAELVVTEDGREVFRSGPLSAEDAPVPMDAAITGAGRLRFEARSLGDGILSDAVVVGDAMVLASGAGLWLDAAEPWMARTGWGKVGLGRGVDGRVLSLGGVGARLFAHGLSVAAEGEIAFEDLAGSARRSAEALALVERAAATEDVRERRALLHQAIETDERCIAAYLELGRLEYEQRFLKRALWCGRRAVDRGGATREQLAQARGLLDDVYTELYSPPTSPARLRLLGRLEESDLLRVICEPTPDGVALATGEATLPIPADGAWQVTTLTRGLRVKATVVGPSGEALAASDFVVDPVLRFEAPAGECSLRLEHDFASDRYGLPLEVVAAFGPEAAKPLLDWDYRPTGSGPCEVTARVGAPCVIPVPLTAEMLHVDGGGAALANTAMTYGAELADYDSSSPLLVVPDGAEATVRFRWMDGACTLPPPMGHYSETAGKIWFHSIRMLNAHASGVRVSVHPPGGYGEIVEAAPDDFADAAGEVFTWDLGPEGFVRFVFECPNATTKYLHRQVENMTIHIPAASYYAMYESEFVDHMRDLYTRLRDLVGGYESEHEIYVLVPNPVQLPGYGGATWGGDEYSESWVPAGGFIGEYPLRYRWNGLGIHSHELHWMFLNGAIPELPAWLHESISAYTEIAGDEAMGQIGWDDWPRENRYRGRFADYRQEFTEPETGYAWWDRERVKSLSGERKATLTAVRMMLGFELEERLGPDFWGDFCRTTRDRKSEYEALADDRARTLLALRHMVEVSGDAGLTGYFAGMGWPVEDAGEVVE